MPLDHQTIKMLYQANIANKSLLHQVLLLLLLLVNQRVDQGVQETIERRQNSRTTLLDASVVHLHAGSCLQTHLLLVASTTRKMLRKTHTLGSWNIECLGKLLNPAVSFSFGLRVVSVEDYDDALGLLHDSWPDSVVFDVA